MTVKSTFSPILSDPKFLAEPEVLGVLEDIITATAVEKVWQILTVEMAKIGFERLIYGFTRYRTETSFGDPQDILLLSNAGEDYINGFIGDGFYRDAPMVRWAAENVGACSWSWAAKQAMAGGLSDAEMKVLAFNKGHRATCGYTISFPDTLRRDKGAIALIGGPDSTQEQVDNIWACSGRALSIITNVAHMKVTRLPFEGMRRSLTDRQREVLGWVGDGKTSQDIATIMGLTTATVEKHLRLARETLDVGTTAQAVLKAAFQNQIFTPSE